jgi:hypothetical protein
VAKKKERKLGDYLIPFCPTSGNSLYWTAFDPGQGGDKVVWKQNHIFDDGLAVIGYSRGRSAANIDVQSVNDGKKYTIFLTDFMQALTLCENTFRQEVNGEMRLVLVGHWGFVKRGQNYGIRVIQ